MCVLTESVQSFPLQVKEKYRSKYFILFLSSKQGQKAGHQQVDARISELSTLLLRETENARQLVSN